LDCPPPPAHIRSCIGPLEDINVPDWIDSDEENELQSTSSDGEGGVRLVEDVYCYVCQNLMDPKENFLQCVHSGCPMTSHLRCLADLFLTGKPTTLVPTSGMCPECNQMISWGDLIKKMKLKKTRGTLQPIDPNVQIPIIQEQKKAKNKELNQKSKKIPQIQGESSNTNSKLKKSAQIGKQKINENQTTTFEAKDQLAQIPKPTPTKTKITIKSKLKVKSFEIGSLDDLYDS